ncbi:MAG: hypothetical protein NUW23_10415 [Firmicutes bacterium]|jgi:hypothetical protein|nr:hypothetical protein [Bacillota bacterium]
MQEDRKAILEMVRDGKLTVDEAQKLLEAIESPPAPRQAAAGQKESKFIRVNVKNEDGTRVNVNVPVNLARVVWKFIPKDTLKDLEEKKIDLDEILTAIEQGAGGRLVDVESDDGTKVEIYID